MALSAPEGLTRASTTAPCYCWASQARFAGRSWSPSTSPTSKERITIRRSETDQEGHGMTIAIVRGCHACPVKAVKAWLAASGIIF
jgi:hypothetical protein